MKLYHTSNTEIRDPDIYRGRKNADFGPGFYLTPDMDFAYRWAGKDAIVNEYELDEEGLLIHRFKRDEDWFNYIFQNRRVRDGLSVDVVIGPIANDTIFETLGIISSGLLSTANAMKILMIGPEFTQAAIKTEKAASQLKWIRSEKITKLDEAYRRAEQAWIRSEKITKLDEAYRRAEQAEYDAAFAEVLQEIIGEE